MEGKVCIRCGVWKPMEEYYRHKASKGGRRSQCKSCIKNNQPKETREGMKKCSKCGEWKKIEEYCKDKQQKSGLSPQCKKCRNEYFQQYYKDNTEKRKQYYKDNIEHIKEREKQYHKDNIEHLRERMKQYYKDNTERFKKYRNQYYKDNIEHIKERKKQRYKDNKENNLQIISNTTKQARLILKDLPIYGYIYVFINTKTGHAYIGQTIQPLKKRYRGNIIKGWIKDRGRYKNQKFKDELIEEDFIVIEVLDVGICKWHLDKLEAKYIAEYDSCNNGYNNNDGHHDTDDGIEEFNKILEENGLKFVDGKLIEK